MFWAFISLLAGAPFIAIGICFHISRKEKKEEQQKKLTDRWLNANNSKVRYYGENDKSYEFEIKKLTRMTLERFLNLYQVSPSKWYICTNSNNFAYYCPCYVQEEEKIDKRGKKKKEDILIPIFWENPEELDKYVKWVENKYRRGDAAVFQEKRDEYAKKLTEYIQKDLEEKRKQSLAELEKLEEEFKKERAASANKPIELTLQPETRKTTVPQYREVETTWDLYRDAYDAKMSDITYVKETGKSFAWNGTEWVELAPGNYAPYYTSTTATQAVTFPPPVSRA